MSGKRRKSYSMNPTRNLILKWMQRQVTKIINAIFISRKIRIHFIVMDLHLTGGGHITFCNPPYGREIGKWVRKAYETQKSAWNYKHKTIVVMLVPSRTDTKWFHDYIYNKENVEVRFLKGRLKFGNAKNSAPFPSMIVVFK